MNGFLPRGKGEHGKNCLREDAFVANLETEISTIVRDTFCCVLENLPKT
jgi:hypothetical protein